MLSSSARENNQLLMASNDETQRQAGMLLDNRKNWS